MSQAYSNRNLIGIFCVLGGTFALGIQDMIIKLISDTYALHEIGFIRSIFAIMVTCTFLHMEGGFALLKTNRLGAHILRGVMVVCANMAYFLGLASMHLADAAAIFFSAPLIITLLAIPLLGEKVGLRRWIAVIIGMAGVLIMLKPDIGVVQLVGLLPLTAAFCYALMQIMARRLGTTESASAMAFYIQVIFLLFSLAFGLVFGSGSMAPDGDNKTLDFLLRAWVWPDTGGLMLMAACGLLVGIGGFLLTKAYKIAQARSIAPFEYSGLPFAVLLGFIVWGHVPGLNSMLGIGLILIAGLYVLYRENKQHTHDTLLEPAIRD